jgi:signal transduction histidine kinase
MQSLTHLTQKSKSTGATVIPEVVTGTMAALRLGEEKLAFSADSCLTSMRAAAASAEVQKGSDEQRLEAVVETLAGAQSKGEGLPALAHDARNMVTALGLYCELLEKPGVLTPACQHYGSELRLLAAASRRLVEKLVTLDFGAALVSDYQQSQKMEQREAESTRGRAGSSHFLYTPAEPIANLALELRANHNLLAALAGPAIHLRVVTTGGEMPVRLTGEDLTRILVNLVKNAAESMPEGGAIEIALTEELKVQTVATDAAGAMHLKTRSTHHKTGSTHLKAEPTHLKAGPTNLNLTITDNGPGIPEEALEAVFDAGFSTRAETDPDSNWPGQHRGLGLSITRSILESAGGSIHAFKATKGGAGFEILLPVRRLGWLSDEPTLNQNLFQKQEQKNAATSAGSMQGRA